MTDATITLLIDPGTMLLTCDIEGVLCSQAGAYSENFSDFVWWMLTELKSIDSSDIDSVAFTALKSERNQHGGYYLNSFMQTLDLMRIFQASALFQLIPLLNGRWTVKYYTTGSTGAPILYKDDLHDLGIEYATDGVFMGVIVGYKKDCATGEYQKVMVFDEKIYYRYGEVGILEVESALYLKAETEALAAFFLNLVKVPPKRIDGEIGPIGFNKNPTDKIIFNKTITDGDGNEVTVFADSVYRILEFRKNLTPVTTGFMGVDDSISLGSFHADSPYEDSHGDAYTDTAHGDVVHADNVHEDAAHQDVPHVDIAHTDTHVDAHADGHADYADRVHIDWHQDAYYDTHSDIPHQDSHTDSYGDTPHGDTIHTDTPYYESYSDYHSDIGHSDAYY